MNAEGRVTIIQGETFEGDPIVALQFPDVGFTVDPAMVSYANGRLNVGVPATIDLPLDAIVVDRWLPATKEEAALAVEGLDPLVIEKILLRESKLAPSTPWGRLARAAVALAISGDTGEPNG